MKVTTIVSSSASKPDYITNGDFSAPATFPIFAEGHREIVLCETILRSHKEER